MKKHLYNHAGTKFIREVEAEPVCEQDFCDACGDCLACFGDGDCYCGHNDDCSHFWVDYEKTRPD